jgi:putative PIN family toxin of toxin-antitoxin system
MRIVIDTNVFISGLLFKGKPKRVLDAVQERKFIWVVSADILYEYRKTLLKPKFRLKKSIVDQVIELTRGVAEEIAPKIVLDAVPRCPADNKILECAVDCHCDLVVTGDKRDLLSLKKFMGVQMISVTEFCEEFLK